jgi:hypothetical protein
MRYSKLAIEWYPKRQNIEQGRERERGGRGRDGEKER